jgi:hypothetical protein
MCLTEISQMKRIQTPKKILKKTQKFASELPNGFRFRNLNLKICREVDAFRNPKGVVSILN